MSDEHKTLIGAIEELSRRLGGSPGVGAGGSGTSGTPGTFGLPIFKNAISDPREEVILCYTVGKLSFTTFDDNGQDETYGLLDMALYYIDSDLSAPDGRYQTIWKPEVPNPSVLYKRTEEYKGPFDRVVKPIPKFHMTANSNAVYEFNGRGKIFATGPANLLLVPFDNDPQGPQIFQISVAALITGGTDEFWNCSGVNTALGSSFVAKGTDVLNTPAGESIGGITVSGFRVVKGNNVGRRKEQKGDRP